MTQSIEDSKITRMVSQVMIFMASHLRMFIDHKVTRYDSKLDAGYSVAMYKVGDNLIRLDIKLPPKKEG
jgi:hypothetical protein